ncbi:hypothetical protein O181_066077 [Austropuccinia psidii MF-1]|uniref:Uncharacterized protein n=1 Tax=Austropuccinia psidii MF-1 TaxID=1389203 RepID=A0A9Q3I3X6_9BASI|nr:hypothetical protein [Austropuccinia psidii MF-1]
MSPVDLRDLEVTRNQPEDQILERMVHGRTIRELITTLPFTLKFNRKLEPEDLTDMGQVIQLHQLLKDFFQRGMEKKSLNLDLNWEEIVSGSQKICL